MDNSLTWILILNDIYVKMYEKHTCKPLNEFLHFSIEVKKKAFTLYSELFFFLSSPSYFLCLLSLRFYHFRIFLRSQYYGYFAIDERGEFCVFFSSLPFSSTLEHICTLHERRHGSTCCRTGIHSSFFLSHSSVLVVFSCVE